MTHLFLAFIHIPTWPMSQLKPDRTGKLLMDSQPTSINTGREDSLAPVVSPKFTRENERLWGRFWGSGRRVPAESGGLEGGRSLSEVESFSLYKFGS